MPQRPDTAVRPRATKRGAGLRWATLAAALPACTTWPALLGGLSGVELRAPPVHSPGPAGEDRVDNDCDDQIDEPGEREQRGLFRYDRDADGAQLGDPFSACAPPAGAVPLTGVWAPTDCDDNDAARHPGAAERCLDRGDEDCDGRADCSDPDCAGLPCAEDCTDPTDNDADGLDDCADPDCPPGLYAEDCAAGGDRDRDGRAGCADPDCFGPACAEDCAAPGDEDGDGLPDCEDVDCVDACA
ncbi:MAG: putative metal-binding motif-containing protein [Deltaproteobacteria bacterium]|nr:putative metal-binding motif-containing protein [Deltaproteobacteria bacterium]